MLLFGRIISSVASQSNGPETMCKQPLKDVLAQTSSLHLKHFIDCCTWRFLMWQAHRDLKSLWIFQWRKLLLLDREKLMDGNDCHVILKFKTTELRHYITCGSLFGHSGSGCWVGFAVTLWVMATLSMFSMLLNVCRIQKERHVESLTTETEA